MPGKNQNEYKKKLLIAKLKSCTYAESSLQSAWLDEESKYLNTETMGNKSTFHGWLLKD